jgi:hypothetical protein
MYCKIAMCFNQFRALRENGHHGILYTSCCCGYIMYAVLFMLVLNTADISLVDIGIKDYL